MEISQFENVNIVLSTFCVAFVSAIIYLFNANQKLVTENKQDLKLFDLDSKKSSKELLDVLNKFYLSLEESKLSDQDDKRKLQRIIDLLEKKG